MNTPTAPAAPPAPFSGGIPLRIVNYYNTMLLTQFITFQGDDFRNQERVTKILAAQFREDKHLGSTHRARHGPTRPPPRKAERPHVKWGLCWFAGVRGGT
ncbi:hypothetical protein ACH41E_20825 [Streptomyces sp. NPDC020412]|uniref:hypothetical protein n=1 Tax=Streptomyces sp. NPDC020412 TaxID=3365073 RepID=UPI0037AD729A